MRHADDGAIVRGRASTSPIVRPYPTFAHVSVSVFEREQAPRARSRPDNCADARIPQGMTPLGL